MKLDRIKIINIISYITLALAFGLLVVVIAWLVYPYKTLVIKENPIKILTPTVIRGTSVTYKIDFCKYTKLSAVVQDTFENDITFPATQSTGTNATGCHVLIVSRKVPEELPVGTYRLKKAFIYQVNPIREVSIIGYTEYFKVIERE